MAILIAKNEREEDGVVELKRAEGLMLVLDTPKGRLLKPRYRFSFLKSCQAVVSLRAVIYLLALN